MEDDNSLKVTALTQRIAEITADYESRIVDLRVLVTRQQEKISRYEYAEPAPAPESESESEAEEEVLEGTVL